MYSQIILWPLMASLVAGIFGRYLGYRGAAFITTASVFLSTLLSFVAFYEVALSGVNCTLEYHHWFPQEMFDPHWGFYFDTLTVVMLLVVNIVSTLVHLYSISYMWQDPHLPRFMCYLSCFTAFMLMLVTADNFLQMFFGWEGVGVSSYLLINFWSTRLQANKSSIKAMLMNRIGDFGLALGILTCYSTCKTINFSAVFSLAGEMSATPCIFLSREWPALECICILLFVGAVGKSAQLGLHTWLPDAMEGPTPVSALIHAATMVTAGVFLLARCSPLFELAPNALILVALLGAATCFFAATTGVVQNDLKRVIAYSTCSQLGYMVFACGISNYAAAVFHLMNHAFFKALLFLSAGSVIHGLSNEQDMRKMGGVAQSMPFTYGMMLIGSASLVGFPFLTGYYSKDLILELAAARYTLSGDFVWLVGVLCVFFTAYYSFRLLACTFLASTSAHKGVIKNAHDPDLTMCLPLAILAFGSIFVGYFAKDMMVGLGTNFWANSLCTLPANVNMLESEMIPAIQRWSPLIFTFLGAATGIAFHVWTPGIWAAYNLKKTQIGQSLYMFLNKRWLFDKVYNSLGRLFLNWGYSVTFKTLDKGTWEILGPWGISQLLNKIAVETKKLETGMIYHYAVVMLIGLTLLISGVVVGNYLPAMVDLRLYFLFCVTLIFSATLVP